MKRILYFLPILLVLAVSSCTDKFEDFNTDTKNPDAVPGESLFTNAQKELSDYINNTNVNINIFKLIAQYWTETTYTDEANYDLITRNISANIYNRNYLRVLKDLDEAKSLIETTEVLSSEEAAKNNKLQIIEMMNVYVYAHLVDAFGAVPYTDALNIDNVYPTYDSGEDIYADLFSRLDAAIDAMDPEAGSFDDADIYYEGDAGAWIKFGNTLKIRMAITTADANSSFSKTAVEEAVAGAFTSNDDDCLLAYQQASPNYNQLYADLVASGRHDFVPANTIVDIMNDMEDPRSDAYFADKIDTSSVDGVEKLAYVGGDYGYSNSFGQCSHIGVAIQEPTFSGIMLTYSELCFYLAEAAERGYSVNGTAEEWYDKGIEASFDYWGVSGADAYLAKPEVAYTTATGTWKEKIGLQSWLANYTRGATAYNTWRRLDYPVFNLPENAESYDDIPVRFTFPVNEQTLNATNYSAASEMIGGDLISTKIFWDLY
jgi:hypothetical protein